MDRWFLIAHVPAAIGWIALLAAPFLGRHAVPVARIAGAALAIGYLILFAMIPDGLRALAADYSIDGIASLFTDRRALLLGWVHYLAFDLWVAAWEVEEGRHIGLTHWLVAPCVMLTIMLGPLGLLLFLAIRGRRGAVAA